MKQTPVLTTILSAALVLAAVFSAKQSVIAAGQGTMNIHSLRCEYLDNPLAVEAKHPRLEWRLDSAGRGRRQTAYRILVASTRQKLGRDAGDLWDSGRVESDRISQLE